MRLAAHHRPHLTYCSNIHPGETWPDVFANLQRYVPAVKAKVAPDRAFAIGLRLSAQACAALQRDALAAFIDWLRAHDLYVFTLNGFPYGPFHGAPVKESVYRPDWQEAARVQYTMQLLDRLAALLPADHDAAGSISTVPGCYLARIATRTNFAIMQSMVQCVAHAWAIRERGGPQLVIALEPEPHCLLETTADAIEFVREQLWSREAVVALTQATGLSKSGAEAALRRHIGICVDTCHAAVEYESADDILDDLAAAELQVGKIQVTAGLRVAPVTAEQLAFLREFADDVYLHQVVARRGDTLVRFADLPQAFADARTHVSCDDMGRVVSADEWRVHFHVPIFTEPERFGTTHAFVRRFIEALKRRQSCRHLEVETYTWDVLPAAWRERGVVDAIAQELRWVERLWNE